MPAKAPKRKRTSSTTSAEEPLSKPNGHANADKHALFADWATTRGVQIHSVKPAQLPNRGLGLVVTTPIKKDDQILFVPEKATFTPTISSKPSNPTSLLRTASPQAQLAACAMSACRSPDSEYSIWKNTWPTEQDFIDSMPMCWTDEMQALLPPTVSQPYQRQRDDYSKDWKAVQAFCEKLECTEREFRYYWMIVNSRSFHWKPPKGKAAGSMVMCPFIDYMNHGPSGTGVNVYQSPEGYEVVADRDYAPGEEILATYGAHTNDKLLVHYGFVCSYPLPSPSSPSTITDDDIRLDHIILPLVPSSTKEQLQDVGFLGSYALLPGTNELCFKTQVAVRAVLLTCNEWECFITSGEDLAEDQNGAVKEFLREGLEGYVHLARERVEEVERLERNGGGKPGFGSMRLRWTQIGDAVDAFLRNG